MEDLNENRKFKVYEDMLKYQQKNIIPIPKLLKEVMNNLGDRIFYMEYTKNDYNAYGWPNIIDCISGATSEIGIKISDKLKELIPNCKIGSIGKNIILSDVINPRSIPNIVIKEKNGKYKFYGSEELYLFEDNRYIVGIRNTKKYIYMYFFRKMNLN